MIAQDRQKRILGQKEYLDNLMGIESKTWTTYTTTATSYEDIVGSDYEFVLSEKATVLVILSTDLYTDTWGEALYAIINVDNVDYEPAIKGWEDQFAILTTTHLAIELEAGTHTIKARVKVDSGQGYVAGKITTLFLQIKY